MLGELCLSFPKQEKVLPGKGPFSIAQDFCFLETGLAGECAASALVGVAGLLLFAGCCPSEASSGNSLVSLVCEAGSRIVAGISRARGM